MDSEDFVAAWFGRRLTARQRRRARHRAWQARDRQSRAGKPLPVFDDLSGIGVRFPGR